MRPENFERIETTSRQGEPTWPGLPRPKDARRRRGERSRLRFRAARSCTVYVGLDRPGRDIPQLNHTRLARLRVSLTLAVAVCHFAKT